MQFVHRPALLLAASLVFLGAAASAAPRLRHQVELRGDVALIGNTLGFDCRAAIPRPLVGSVDTAACGAATSDSEIDVLWRADEPGPGQAVASPAITPELARSTAVLALPAGAVVAYARLYWAAARGAGEAAGQSVLLERPGAFAQLVAADASDKLDGASTYYQSSADVTAIVQDLGPGPLRVGAVAAASPVGVDARLSFAAWALVVFYKRAADPPRNLTLFDGLERVDDTRPVAARLERFLVPDSGFDGHLGVIAYEGDADTAGDRLRLNDQDLGDAQSPADNFFNGSRGALGAAVTRPGDLPQLSGLPGSMNGLDLDLVDVTAHLRPGATSAQISAQSAEDVYFLGALCGAVATRKPVFIDTDLTYVNLSNPGGAVRPGDLLELTLTTRNTGSDVGVDVGVGWTAPPELSYEPGSLRVARGPGAGDLSDGAGDDQGEFDGPGRTVRVRIGAGASADRGGRVAPGDPPIVVRFRVRVAPEALGRRVRTAAVVRAAGEVGERQGIPPMSWTSGNGVFPNRPIELVVRECEADRDCPLQAPRCSPMNRCSNGCQADADCAGRPTGAVCLPTMTCGCQADGDCPSGACSAGACRIPEADLSLEVRLLPEPPARDRPVTHVLIVTNRGPDAAPSVTVRYRLPDGARVPDSGIAPGEGWECMQAGREVVCVRDEPLSPGTAGEIRILVVPPPGAGTLDVVASATSPFASDPVPGDNHVARGVDLGEDILQLAGGGVSCRAARGGAGAPAPGAVGDAAVPLLLLALLLLLPVSRPPSQRRRGR